MGEASVVVIMLHQTSQVSILSWPWREGSATGQQLVENHAEAEDVRSSIDPMPLAPGLLGAHVSGCPSDPATLAEILVLERKSEVGDKRLSRCIDQDVGGLDVPVDQPSCMSVMKGFGDCCHQCRRLVKTGAAFLDPPGKVASLDELRDHEAEPVVGSPHVINRHDMGMVETGKDAGFVQVRLNVLGLRDSIGAGNFDGNRTVEIIVVGKDRPFRTRPCPRVRGWCNDRSSWDRSSEKASWNPHRRSLRPPFDERFSFSSIARSLISTDLFLDAEWSHCLIPMPGRKSDARSLSYQGCGTALSPHARNQPISDSLGVCLASIKIGSRNFPVDGIRVSQSFALVEPPEETRFKPGIISLTFASSFACSAERSNPVDSTRQ